MTGELLDTPEGPARLSVRRPAGSPCGTLVLGHGAGGARWTDDVLAVRDVALAAGWLVVLVDQPWRVAGRRVAARPEVLDRAWLSLSVRFGEREGPVVVGGRSAGARVACRTAAQVGAAAVLAISFPLHPPGRPERSRAAELGAPAAHGIRVHVIQGRADPMGSPEEVGAVLPSSATLDVVDGAHSLERASAAVARSALGRLEGAARGLGGG